MSAERVRVLELGPSDAVPPEPEPFLRALGGPALVRLRGRDSSRTRALATLLHGDEPSGLRALIGRLRAGAPPAVDTLVFVGAVAAALGPPPFVHRYRPGRADLNRCFRAPFDGEDGALAREALERLRGARPEALVDLHNNSGHSPPYGVTAVAGERELALISLFAERAVHTALRIGALFEATREDFPSVVVECGRSGDPEADRAARAGLDRYLDADRLDVPAPEGLRLYVDPIRVCVRPRTRLAISDRPERDVDLTIREDVDRHNFELLEPGAVLGWTRGAEWPLEAFDAERRDVSRELFEVLDGRLVLRRSLVPVMMTTDARAALSDCLFYAARPGPGARRP